MSEQPRSLRLVKREYDRLRRYYFLDPPEGLHEPLPASEIQWFWLPAQTGLLACTWLDEEEHGHRVGIDPLHRRSLTLLRPTLLHELTHMRNPAIECGWRSPGWRKELVRLAALGAPLL